MKKISVIVPVYNAEEYLHRCLNSIINQSYKELEIIIINDGSTDNSAVICEEFSNIDNRIKLIHQKNGGQSSARNRGIEEASGDYLTFVDSDDWIDLEIYGHCMELIENTQFDVIDFNVELVDEEKKGEVENALYSIKQLEGKEILRDYLYRGQTEKAPFSPCRKLYKYNLFESIRFPEGKVNEDIATNFKLLMNCNGIVITSKIGYYYFQSNNSTTRNGLRKRDFDLLDACRELVELTQGEDYKDIKYLANIKYARSYFSLLAKIAFYGFEDKSLNQKKVINELTEKLREKYFLLIKSPIPFNRKCMITALCINIKCLTIPLKIYKLVK